MIKLIPPTVKIANVKSAAINVCMQDGAVISLPILPMQLKPHHFCLPESIFNACSSISVAVVYKNNAKHSFNVKKDQILERNATKNLFINNTDSPYSNTVENKQLVVDIVSDMCESVASLDADIIRGDKNLIYLSVFGQDYYELSKMQLESIDSNTPNKTFDVLIITDASTKLRFASSAIVESFNVHYMVVDTPANGVAASMTKCNVFAWEKIDEYKKILFLDSDIISFKDITPVFAMEYNSNVLYTVYNENMHYERAFNSKYYSVTTASREQLAAYKAQHQMPFNAGQFLFINSIKMQQHFSNVNWFMKNWPGEYFFEQSFMVEYFCRNFLTAADVIQPHFAIKIITPSVYDPDIKLTELPTFIHFAGAALNGIVKINYIKNFIEEHANIV